MNLIKLLVLSFALTQFTPCAANTAIDALKSVSEFCYQDGSMPALAAINVGGLVALAAAAKYVYKKELNKKNFKQLMIDAKNNPKKHKLLIAIVSSLVALNGNFMGHKLIAKSNPSKAQQLTPEEIINKIETLEAELELLDEQIQQIQQKIQRTGEAAQRQINNKVTFDRAYEEVYLPTQEEIKKLEEQKKQKTIEIEELTALNKQPKAEKTPEELKQNKVKKAQKIAQQQFEITINEIANDRQRHITTYTNRVEEKEITKIKATKAYQDLSTEDKEEMAALLAKYQEQRALIHALQQEAIELNHYLPGDAITRVDNGIYGIQYIEQEIPGSLAEKIKQQLYLLATQKKEQLEMELLRLNEENEVLIQALEKHNLVKKNKDKDIYMLHYKDFTVLSDEEYTKILSDEKLKYDKELEEINKEINDLEACLNDIQKDKPLGVDEQNRLTTDCQLTIKQLGEKKDQIRKQLRLNEIRQQKA